MSLNKVSHKINSWLSENYGSRRGALLTYWYRLLFMFGKYRAYRQINWALVDRVVFVCKGNICRSAYAEVVAKALHVEATSCGINTQDDLPANQCAIMIADMRGVNLQDHKTTRVQSLSVRPNDLLIAMEPWQLDYLKNEFKDNSCTLLGLWGKPINPHIHDPYGASEEYFHRCFCYIEKSIDEITKKISKAS